MKYKVGDKVLVRKDLMVGKFYGCDIFIDYMTCAKGKIATITSLEGMCKYCIDLCSYFWTDEMFVAR